MRIYLAFILTLAVVVNSASRPQTPEEWARQQNDKRFNDEAYHGLPWEEYSKQGFFPREPQVHPRQADSDARNALPPSVTSDDLKPTRTDSMGLIRRAPQGTLRCPEGGGGDECFTFSCKSLGP